MESNGNYISKNWTTLVGVSTFLFTAGGFYSENKSLHTELAAVKKDLAETKEQLFKEIEQRVDNLEEQKAYQDGINAMIKK